MRAEHLHSGVSRMLTGKEASLLNIEVTLTNTYHLAKQKLEKQQGRGKRGRGR